MDRNNDYILPELTPTLINRANSWKSLLPAKQIFKVTDIGPTPNERIIKHDAERIYSDPERRKTLVKLLSCYENHFKDYHQGLGLTCGFLLLILPEQDVANIVSVAASDQKYIPGYWCAEPVAGARDAYVWEYLLQQHHPEVAAHLRKKRSIT